MTSLILLSTSEVASGTMARTNNFCENTSGKAPHRCWKSAGVNSRLPNLKPEVTAAWGRVGCGSSSQSNKFTEALGAATTAGTDACEAAGEGEDV